MSDDLQSAIDAATASTPTTPLSRRQVIPYADLNALNTPTDLNQVSNDLIPTLAILVAQGSVSPKLLAVDDTGALKTAARVNAITRLTAPLISPNTVCQVRDTSQFFPGDHVALITNGNPNVDCVDVVVKQIDSPTQIEFVATCGGINFAVGDYLIGEQTVNVRQIYEAVDISDRAARLLGQVSAGLVALNSVGFYQKSATGQQNITASVDNLNQAHMNVRATSDPPTSEATFTFGGGATPSMSIPALSGLSIDLLAWEIVMVNAAGAATATISASITTTGAGGSTVWGARLACPNTNGTTDSQPKCPFHIVGFPGQGITIAMLGSLPAGYGADISATWTYH